MSIQNALASIAVKDLSASKSWYERLLETPANPAMQEVAEWHFQRGGGLQVYQLPERAGACSATLAADDIEKEISKLKRLNITAQVLPANPRVKVVMIKDPDGNSIAIAEVIDSSLAH